MKIIFSQKWIEDKLKDYFEKDEITSEDLDKIKYLQIGDGFKGCFVFNFSNEEPFLPYRDPWGGDEWEDCTLKGEKIIKHFIEQVLSEEFDDYIDTEPYRFRLYNFIKENEELLEVAPEDNTGTLKEQYIRKKELKKALDKYHEQVVQFDYQESFDNSEVEDLWDKEIRKHILDDIRYFRRLKVLRVQGAALKDFSFVENLEELETLELAECTTETMCGIEKIGGLKQFCVWAN